MTVLSKKTRMLAIIDGFLKNAQHVPEELHTTLVKAKEQLHSLNDEQLDLLTNNVISMPAKERPLSADNPEFLLQSAYAEIEKIAREENNAALQKVVQEMQYYFNIEEKDGFFP